MTNKTDMVQCLRKHSITPTAPRLEIASLLAERPQHLSAEEVYSKLKLNGKKIARASVYNNLHLFARVGFIKPLNVSPSLTIYDTNTNPHHHLFDIDTGTITDIDESTKLPQSGERLIHNGKTWSIEFTQTILFGRLA